MIGLTGVPASQTVCGEKGVNTTILTYASAGGLVMPPTVIFKAGKVDKNWREAAPSGYAIRCSKTGYINQVLFAESGEIFVRFLKEKGFLGNNQKCLLLLDSHKSHLFNIHFMNYLKCNNVEVVCFPPHCTHLLQPLDDTPYGAFKSCYQQELAEWNNRHLGVKMSKTDFFRVLIPAYTRALTPQIVQKGFANTGIYPINPQASKLQRIGPSIVSDKYSKCQFRKSWLKLVSCWFVRSEISKRDFFRTGSKQDFLKNAPIFLSLVGTDDDAADPLGDNPDEVEEIDNEMADEPPEVGNEEEVGETETGSGEGAMGGQVDNDDEEEEEEDGEDEEWCEMVERSINCDLKVISQARFPSETFSGPLIQGRPTLMPSFSSEPSPDDCIH